MPIWGGGGGGASPVFQTTVDISGTALQFCGSVEVEVLPDPGVGNFYVLLGGAAYYFADGNTGAFSDPACVITPGADVIMVCHAPIPLTDGETGMLWFDVESTPVGGMNNAVGPLFFTMINDAPDPVGTLRLSLVYAIAQIPT